MSGGLPRAEGTPTTVLRVPAPTGPTRSGQLWAGPVTVWARQWPHDPDWASLLITGGHSGAVELPARASVNEWLHTLSMWGYKGVRTGAVSPEIAAGLQSVGFRTVQDLVLMNVDLGRDTVHGRPAAGVEAVREWPRIPTRTLARILSVDAASFGPPWALDRAALAEARRATVRSRLFVTRAEGEVVGFVLAGATGADGYVQRLAVHPDHRRRRVAVGLLDAAHHWLRRRGCSVAWVNTERSNTAADVLYRGSGYVPVPYGLQVLERRLDEGDGA